ncbi:hypothetical protein FAM09_16700 [Niastella caeni]|uniref:Uncharacterized protein n=1 Tax=Niastella caeni TaxID=2569763 RepID=A0A4S8HSQ0_9BACT|nr:hypothetical protein [Niastella caeni]THU38315.1 hypothetical protein FAM09_16700 [Niastella caeni]
MPLFIRKLLVLFLLSNMVFGSLMARQIPIPVGFIVGALTYHPKEKAVKQFRSYKFDSTDAIIGIDFSDSANGRYKKFSFIIDNVHDLNEFRKSWIYKNSVEPATDKGVFNVYYIKNKVKEKAWIIFPELKSIVTDNGHNSFDTSILSTLHSKYPLVYRRRTDTVRGKDDFLKFNDSVKANPSFLFLIEPYMAYEGSFDVTIKAGSGISPEDVGERIHNKCNKIKPKTAFNVFLKVDENGSDAKHKTYFVRCNQALYVQFSDPELEKGDWTPAVFVVQSYWRE